MPPLLMLSPRSVPARCRLDVMNAEPIALRILASENFPRDATSFNFP